jgi:hypothetical protein
MRQQVTQATATAPADHTLSDVAIEGTLRTAFAPHRCDVKLQMDSFVRTKKVALIIHASRAGGTGARPFIVEGVPVEALRRRDALLTYIDDVREQLRRHNVDFTVRLQREH